MASRIREVWASNLEAEMRNIRDIVDRYPYVAMDTEFPGVVARPIGTFKTSSDYHYQTMRCNVDLLRIIQIGITLCNEQGDLAQETSTWQFNFQFNVMEDMFSPDSYDLLVKSGIDFNRHLAEGINPNDFAELLITSGLVLSDDIKWLSFHSGYDFGYLVKLLSCVNLPSSEEDFFELLSLWFPNVYDIKVMMRACKGLKGGLQDVADDLGVMRIGPSHQAGSDSLLTAVTFFKMREIYFNDRVDDIEYNGKLFGLGQSASVSSPANGALDPTASASLGMSLGMGMGLGGYTGMGMSSMGMNLGTRSGATIAERERTPLPRENGQTQGQQQGGQVQGTGQTMGYGGGMPLQTPNAPGMGAFSPYAAMQAVNGQYLRQIGVGGDR